MYDNPPGLVTKIIATLVLLAGSILAFIFVVKIFICIWDRQTYLMPGFVALAAAGLIYGGSRLWERWRIAMGRIWLALCGLAFFNSFYYLKLAGLPGLSTLRLMAWSNGLLVMGCAAFILAAGLVAWQEIVDRKNCGAGNEFAD